MPHSIFDAGIEQRAVALGVELRVGGAEVVDDLRETWLALFDHHAGVVDVDFPMVERSETWPRRRDGYLHHLAEGGFVLFACRGAGIVGAAVVYLERGLDDTWTSGERVAELETLAVLPAERGRGLGTLLLDAVDDRVAALGVRDLRLGVVSGNTDARRLYERRGFVPTLTAMRRHLDAGDHPRDHRDAEDMDAH